MRRCYKRKVSLYFLLILFNQQSNFCLSRTQVCVGTLGALYALKF